MPKCSLAATGVVLSVLWAGSVLRPFDGCVAGQRAVAQTGTVEQASWMFYRPSLRETGRMWDTWLFFRDGKYYLYYLANQGKSWDNVSMALSDDGVHWKEQGVVLTKAADAVWMGTGSTWRSPRFAQDGKYFLNFSEWRGKQQTIFFAESTDLVHWRRLGRELEFKPNPRWYNLDRGDQSRWDCIYTIPREEGGLWGYWTANPKGRIGVGFGQTLDGVRWEALAPPTLEWDRSCEAGAVEKLGAKYYLMLGTGDGTHHGMFTFLADRPQGPFQRARKNFRLLTSQGHGNTYFARFFPTPGGMLVSHHSIARSGEVFMGTVKRAAIDQEGTLRLAWWEGNEKLKHERIDVSEPSTGAVRPPILMLERPFDAASGVVLEGVLSKPSARGATRGGLYVEHAGGSGTAILVGPGSAAELGPIRPDGSGFKGENQLDREMQLGPTARLRLLVKETLVEFYLDDMLIQCYSMPERASGRLGLIVGEGGHAPRELRAWK